MSRLRPRRPSGDQARKQAGMEAAVEPPAAETSRPKKRTGTSKYDFVKVKVWLGESRSHYYVLSRFLISRMLTLSKIPYIKAVKIALEVKKYLVDHSMLEVTQEELERILLQLITAKGLGSQYIDCYKMVTQFFQQRQPLIIVICGTAWTGKSTIAQQLASRINIPNVMQTDVIHELLQAQPGSGLSPGGLCLRPGLEGPALVEEFQRECTIVRRGMDGDFIKTLSSGKPLIVEGLHLDPGAFIQEFERLGLVMLPARTTHSSAASPADTPRPSPWGPVQDTASSRAATPADQHDHSRTAETQSTTAATTAAAAAESCGSGGSDPSGHRSDQAPNVAKITAEAGEAVSVAAAEAPTSPATAAAAAAAGWQSQRLPTIHEAPDAAVSPELRAGTGVAAARVTSGAHPDTYTPPVSPGVPLVAVEAQGPPLWQPVLPAGADGGSNRQTRVPGQGAYSLNSLGEGWGDLGPPLLPRASSSTRDAACLSREHSTTEVVSREDSWASNEEEEEDAGIRLEGQALGGCQQDAPCSSSGPTGTSSRQQGRVRRSRRGAGGRDPGPRGLDTSGSNSTSRATAEQLLAPVLQLQQAAASERSAARAQRRQAQLIGSSHAAQEQHGGPPASVQQACSSLDSMDACLGCAPGSHASEVHLAAPDSQQQQQQQQQPEELDTQQQPPKQLPAVLQVQDVPTVASGDGGRSQQPLFVPVVLCMDPTDHIMVAEEALAHLVLPPAASSNHQHHHGPTPSSHLQEGSGNGASAGTVDPAVHGSAAADAQAPASGGAAAGTGAAAVAAVGGCPPAGPAAPDVVQQAVQRAQRLQAYLCSFEAQGLPVVKLSYGCFGDALDKLHEYVLQCIKVAMQWDSSTAPSAAGEQP